MPGTKSIRKHERNFDERTERFLWQHPNLGFLLLFIGVPLFVLAFVCADTRMISSYRMVYMWHDPGAAGYIHCFDRSARRAVYRYFGGVRHGIGSPGHRHLLVSFWAMCPAPAHPNRRYGGHHGGGILRHTLRQKNISYAAQYHAGGQLSPQRGRHCAVDGLYHKDNPAV